MAQWRKRTVNATVVGSIATIYNIFMVFDLVTRQRDVEFRHSICKALKNQWKMENVVS